MIGQRWVHKKWFPWAFVALLLCLNIVAFQFTQAYFTQVSELTEEVKVEQSVLGEQGNIIEWAKQILRFLRNP
jgi:hypothetical protein